MMGCGKCRVLGGVIFLTLGVLFLLRDLNMWGFWNIQWWTALFLVVGLMHVAQCHCLDCKAMIDKKK